MMKVTKKQFEKALAALPKLREADAIVKAWNDGLKAIGPAAEHMDVTEIGDDGSFKGKPKEVPRVVAKTA